MPVSSILLAAAALAPGALSAIDGHRLREGTQCFALEREGVALGSVTQRIEAASPDTWRITIHQSLPARGFDMRDIALVRRDDLAPIWFRNFRGGALHVALDYRAGEVTRTLYGAEAGTRLVPLDGPVVDANLWGPLLTALALDAGRRFELPAYHYDRGATRFVATVVGDELVAGRPAWRTTMGWQGGNPVPYLIAKDDGTELGVEGPFVQRLLPDCPA